MIDYVDPFIKLNTTATVEEPKMLTLADIDEMFPETHDGSIYSDLYKSVYGSRPRYATFASVEEFNSDFEFLVKRLNEKHAEDEIRHEANWAEFLNNIELIKSTVSGISTRRAVELLAEAEGICDEELKFYDWKYLEYRLGLAYNVIAPYLASEDENEAFLNEMKGQ